jgi:fructose/tagatose bisphosphate aldolase
MSLFCGKKRENLFTDSIVPAYDSNNAAKDFVSSFAKAINGKSVEKLLQNRFYSIMIDESTDNSQDSNIAINVRFVDQSTGNVEVRLLNLLNIEDGKSETIFNCVAEELSKNHEPKAAVYL